MATTTYSIRLRSKTQTPLDLETVFTGKTEDRLTMSIQVLMFNMPFSDEKIEDMRRELIDGQRDKPCAVIERWYRRHSPNRHAFDIISATPHYEFTSDELNELREEGIGKTIIPLTTNRPDYLR